MFYCDRCRIENRWPQGLSLSYGRCESCSKPSGCYDVPHWHLPVKEKKMKTTDVGVIIGRFQVADLHEGHKALIKQVIDQHKKVIILVGVTQVLCSQRNPLDYPTREKMIRSHFPDAIIYALPDQPTDEGWSKSVDTIIHMLCPVNSVTLYGGRDSCLKIYKGHYKKKALELGLNISGTEVRNNLKVEVRTTPDFRAGVIYASQNQYPKIFSTVDMAIFKCEKGKTFILLGRKYGVTYWQLPGGFVDPSDENLEAAAKRELQEETGMYEIGGLTYVGSFKINDWRYRSENDKIVTTLFAGIFSWGQISPADDLEQVAWWEVSIVLPQVGNSHKVLVEKALEAYKNGNIK